MGHFLWPDSGLSSLHPVSHSVPPTILESELRFFNVHFADDKADVQSLGAPSSSSPARGEARDPLIPAGTHYNISKNQVLLFTKHGTGCSFISQRELTMSPAHVKTQKAPSAPLPEGIVQFGNLLSSVGQRSREQLSEPVDCGCFCLNVPHSAPPPNPPRSALWAGSKHGGFIFSSLHGLSSGPLSAAALLLGFFPSRPWADAVYRGLGDTGIYECKTPHPPCPADRSSFLIRAQEGRLGVGGTGSTPRKLRAELQECPFMSLSNGGVETSLPREHSERSVSTCCWKKIRSQWSQPRLFLGGPMAGGALD